MNQPPNNFNNGSTSNHLPDRRSAAKKQVRELFAIQLIVGIGLGAILSVGVVKVMNQLGLTEKTNQIEIIKNKVK